MRKLLSAIALLFVSIVTAGLVGSPASAEPTTEGPHFVQVEGWYPEGPGGFYRGGNNMEPRPNEYRIRDGLVQTTHGISLHTDPSAVERFGGAYAVMSYPSTLQIIQRGKDRQHFEMVPAEPMPLDDYRAALAHVQLKLAQRVK